MNWIFLKSELISKGDVFAFKIDTFISSCDNYHAVLASTVIRDHNYNNSDESAYGARANGHAIHSTNVENCEYIFYNEDFHAPDSSEGLPLEAFPNCTVLSRKLIKKLRHNGQFLSIH